MQEKKFWIYNIVGSIFWAVSINLVGIYFISNYESILDNFGKIALGIMIVLVGYIYFFQKESWMSYMRAKEVEIREKHMKKMKQ